MTTGYSGTPLFKKLGLKDGMAIYVHNAPKAYEDFFDTYPAGISNINSTDPDSADFIHIFCIEFNELESAVSSLKPVLKKSGLMWISWPKTSSKIDTDIKRDPLRTLVLGLDLVDIKVCAVDIDWSGLKFVYRLKDR